MTMKIKILILFFTVCCYAKGSTIPIQSDKEHNTVTRIDMSEYKTINFDNLVKNISCTRLESNLFDYGITMTTHKDRLYIMGRTIAGNKVVIFDKSGQLVKELTFADALLVISMAIIPDAEELWVVSRFKIINKFKLDGDTH